MEGLSIIWCPFMTFSELKDFFPYRPQDSEILEWKKGIWIRVEIEKDENSS